MFFPMLKKTISATGKNSFFARVIIVSVTPILIAALNAVIFATRRTLFLLSFHFDPIQVEKMVSQHAFAFLLLTYLVLPPCSMVRANN